MLNSVSAIVVSPDPVFCPDAAEMQAFIEGLEPGMDVAVNRVDEGLRIQTRDAGGVVSFHIGPMPDEEAVSSIGMADLPEQEAARLLTHRSYARISTAEVGSPMDRMILLIKCGMALCSAGGWAMCVPSSGLCIKAEDLNHARELDKQGPRVWGLDEAEGSLSIYEPKGLWESLRVEAQPANLLLGFVPAEVENQTWFFSAGHSLFGLPEIAFSDGSIEDYPAIRELFRYLFPYFYQRPDELKAGSTVRTSGNELTISFHELPERLGHLQAATGTLRLRIMTTTGVDNEWDS